MPDKNVGSTTGGKCPQCGSYEVWVAMTKPPSYFCRKCGHQFVANRTDQSDQKE
jgi:uncharacterized protein (DUF983 family)